MKTIENITAYPYQKLIIPLDDGSKATLTLQYKVRLQEWYMSLTYGTKTINNRRVFSSPNMLKQWNKTLPFGIGCVTIDGTEPYYIDDFANGRCVLLLLNSTEVASYETYLSSQKNV